MAFTYSANLQNRIALSIWGVQNSALTTDLKVHLDGTWTTGALATGMAFDAYTRITQIANWFEQVGATSAPQAWEHWLVAETCLLLAPLYRPERMQAYTLEREQAIDAALDSYTLRDPTGTFSSSNLSQTNTVNGIRFYVLNHCARRKESGTNTGLRRRIFPPIDEIDSHIQWTLNYVYNKQPWNFRKREVSLIITQIAYPTAATWTNSTKTLTQTGAFASVPSTANLAGKTAKLLLSSGTGVVLAEYQIASKTSDNAIVLAQDIATTPGDLATGDIVGTIFIAEIRGTLSGESFDSTASRKFFYTDSANYGVNTLKWLDATQMDQAKTVFGTPTGRPQFFRTEIQPSDAVKLHLSPFPDDDYVLKGSVWVTGPGTPSSATDTAVFDKFPSEFFTVIRDMVLARVLMNYGASDAERVWGRSVEQVERLLPIYTDQGTPSRMHGILDVYNDRAMQFGAGWGGPLSSGYNGGGGTL